MRSFDLISMCIGNLFRRKVRTLLTVVGVVVGTCAIVVMISIGIGMKKSQEEMLAQMGDLTVISVYNYGNSGKDGKAIVMNDETMQDILKMPGVVTATPFYYAQNFDAQMIAGKNDRYAAYLYNIVGVYPKSLPLLGYTLKTGSYENAFKEPYSVLLGEQFAYEFRDSRKKRGNNRVNPYPDKDGNIPEPFVDPLAEEMIIRLTDNKNNNQEQQPQSGIKKRKGDFKAVVVGSMVEDFQKGYETSRGIFMNIDDLKRLEAEFIKMNKIKVDKDKKDKGYENAKVKVQDITYVAAVEERIKAMGLETNSMETIRKPMEEQVNKQQVFLGIIAGVSMFVAALSIANTMLMSIYERTREIGVMKVVGCFVKDIRVIFLMEAGCIGFLGGVLGIILSYAISFLMNYFGLNIGMGSNPFGMEAAAGAAVSIIPPWLVLGALAFSTFIGVVSGYYPANRAVKISALTAIKQD